MKVIAFHLLDLRDNSFVKVYFHEWEDNKPVFTRRKKRANKYFDKRLANEDIVQLKKAESPTAKTLSVRLEEA